MKFFLLIIFSITSLSIFSQNVDETSYAVRCKTPSGITTMYIGVHDSHAIFINYINLTISNASAEASYDESAGQLLLDAHLPGYPQAVLSERYLNVSNGYLMFKFINDGLEDTLTFESLPSTFNKKSQTFKARLKGYSPKSFKYMSNLDLMICKLGEA